MSTLGIDGLISGLDTTSIISSLMEIEAAPQALLETKKSDTEDLVTALQSLNSKVLSLAEAAEKAATASNWLSFTATSSSSAASATAGTTATTGSLTFSVDAVATKQVSLTSTISDGSELTSDNPPTLTVKKADGTYVSVTADSNSLADIASAINDSDMGVTATLVQVSNGTTPTYRLQFTSQETGTDGSFELYVGDESAVTGGTATRLDANVASAATDATITLWKGTAYEQSYTQSSNTFEDLMTGVDVTVSSVTGTGETVTIDVAPDADEVSSLVSGLIGALGVVFSEISSQTATTTTTNDDGTSSVTGGILSANSLVRNLSYQISQAASYPINGESPSKYGIILDSDGTFTFDEDVFAEALAEDPQGTAEFIQGLAARVQEVAETASDSTDGTITLAVKSQESLADSYAEQIADWDLRLELRRSALQTTFTNLETTLSSLNAQSDWLTSQLESLSS